MTTIFTRTITFILMILLGGKKDSSPISLYF